MSEQESLPLYEKIIYQNDQKFYQLRLVVNEFREKHYIHLRKYFLSFDDGYVPSKEGVSMEASIANIYGLLDGLLEIVSTAEGITGIENHFKDVLFNLEN